MNFKDGTIRFGIDNTYYITKDVGNELLILSIRHGGETILIPSEYSGKKIIGVGEYAFVGNYWTKNIIIPDSIKLIGKAAFADGLGVEKIVFSKRTNELFIGAFAFNGCKNLKEVHINSNNVPTIDGHFLPHGFSGNIFISRSMYLLLDKLNVWKDYYDFCNVDSSFDLFDVEKDFIANYNSRLIYTAKEIDVNNIYSRVLELEHVGVRYKGSSVVLVPKLGLVMGGENIDEALQLMIDYMQGYFDVGLKLGTEIPKEEYFSIMSEDKSNKRRFVLNPELLRKK